ncbi:MAG: IS110 family transposase [Thermoplasmata archaeon]
MESTTYVGLDVHKSVVMATAVDPMGNRIDQRKLGPTDDELTQYLRGLPGEKRVALEATTVWEHFYDAALQAGAFPVLSNPLKTRLIAETSLKSDKVDSEALATLLRLNALPTAFAPPPEVRVLRRLVRDWVFFQRKLTAVRNHTYSILLAKGIPYSPGLLSRKRRREELRGRLPELDRGLDALRALEALLTPLEKELDSAYAKSPEAQLVGTIPGIGSLTAVTLAAFLTPIERFRNVRQVIAYSGLCPTNHQSAETSYQGRLRRDCNHLLQWVLVEASWRHRYQARSGLVARAGKRAARRHSRGGGAITAAQRLVQLVYAVLRRGTSYTSHAPERSRHCQTAVTSAATPTVAYRSVWVAVLALDVADVLVRPRALITGCESGPEVLPSPGSKRRDEAGGRALSGSSCPAPL